MTNSHWIYIGGQPYLTLVAKGTAHGAGKEAIRFYQYRADTRSFVENLNLMIPIADGDKVKYYEFDNQHRWIIIIRNNQTIEKRAVSNISEIIWSVHLGQIASMRDRQLIVSDDGTYAVVANGSHRGPLGHFWIVLLEDGTCQRVEKGPPGTYAPCFMTGNNEKKQFMAMGTTKGIEIWSMTGGVDRDYNSLRVKCKEGIFEDFGQVAAIACSHHLCAVGTRSHKLVVYDQRVANGGYYALDIDFAPTYIEWHLTREKPFLVVSGVGGKMCLVFEIS